MQEYREFIRDTFDRLKRKRTGDSLRLLPIFDDGGAPCGFLRPITADYRESLPGCAAQLSLWRNENGEGLSAKPFIATPDGTEKWLDALVLGREDRLLFLVCAPDGSPIGHIGYSCFDYAAKHCDVDAVLRGVKQGHPGMMTFALRALIAWGIRELKLEAVGLHVFADNVRAIEFYKRNGFVAGDTVMPSTDEPGRPSIAMRLDMEAWKGKYLPIKTQGGHS